MDLPIPVKWRFPCRFQEIPRYLLVTHNRSKTVSKAPSSGSVRLASCKGPAAQRLFSLVSSVTLLCSASLLPAFCAGPVMRPTPTTSPPGGEQSGVPNPQNTTPGPYSTPPLQQIEQGLPSKKQPIRSGPSTLKTSPTMLPTQDMELQNSPGKGTVHAVRKQPGGQQTGQPLKGQKAQPAGGATGAKNGNPPATVPSKPAQSTGGSTSDTQQGAPNAISPASGGTDLSGGTAPGPSGQTVTGTIEYNAQPPAPSAAEVSMMQALNEALIRSPRAAAIRSQLQIAKSGLAAATVAPNPLFFMDRGPVAEQVKRIGPTLTIDPPWKLAFRLLAASRLYKQTKIDLLTNLWQMRSDVRRAYTEVVIAIEAQRTLTELYELTERLLEVSQKRFQAGDVPELDVLRARLATSQADVDRNVGRQRVIRARQQLNVAMGRTVEARIEVPRLPEFLGASAPRFQLGATRHGILPDFSQPVPPLSYYVETALENRLEIKSLAQQIKVNRANYYNAVSNAVPDPIITTGLSQAGNPPFGPRINYYFFTLNIELPITNMNQGDITKYKATARQLKYQVGAQRQQVIADVSSAYNNLLAARERIRVYQEHVLRDSAEVARLSRRSYEVGQSDINSTLLAQQANVQIRQNYLDAVTQYQQAYSDLELASGRPLE